MIRFQPGTTTAKTIDIEELFKGNSTQLEEARRLAQELARSKVSEIVAGGKLERSGFDRLNSGKDAGSLLVESAQGSRYEEGIRGVRQHYPLAAARVHQRPRSRQHLGAHACGTPNTSGCLRNTAFQSSRE